jgi:hypothetical protein
MKKGCLIALAIVTGLAILGVIAVAIVFGLTRGASKAGNEFIALTSAGKIEQAYESSSTALKTQQSLESFQRAVESLGLTKVTSASWSNREMKNDRVHLEGSGTTREGAKVPLTMDLIKENGDWKVLAVNLPAAGVAEQPGELKTPSDQELRALLLDSLLSFNQAVQAKSFDRFHDQLSLAWQEQITPEKLASVFQEFTDKEIEIGQLRNLEAIFDKPPAIDANGLLILSGYYLSTPNRVYFTLKYIYEHPSWKLFGIKVDVRE